VLSAEVSEKDLVGKWTTILTDKATGEVGKTMLNFHEDKTFEIVALIVDKTYIMIGTYEIKAGFLVLYITNNNLDDGTWSFEETLKTWRIISLDNNILELLPANVLLTYTRYIEDK
jgi:hypothetical protein